ncbi:MAG: ParA family protein [Eggerthellaceae bacterium]|nr:ParA family protein [Eggerthellaceae bacterium]
MGLFKLKKREKPKVQKVEAPAEVETKVIIREAVQPTVQKTYKDKKRVKRVVGATQVFAIINQKGGVGKTTTAINLSACLGALGKQVLVIDLDPQGNTTSGYGVERNKVQACSYSLLLKGMTPEQVMIPDIYSGVDIIPATIDLAGAEVELVSEMAREFRLKEAIGKVRGKYDYIIIDCPPSLGLLTLNALVAVDKLLIPLQAEFYALEGVTKLLESMKTVKERGLNTSLDIFGVVLTMYDGRTKLSKEVSKEVEAYFGDKVFETRIPRSVRISEAPSYGEPIINYDPEGRGAKKYKELAEEVISRG